MLNALRRLVHHGVGVVDAHAICTRMFLYQFHYGVVGVAVLPVPLPFQQHLLPGHRYHAGLDHALHGVIVGFFGGAAGGICNHIDFIAGIVHCRQGEGGIAYLGPQAGDDDLVATISLECVAYLLIIPGIHGGALQQRGVREHSE
ncbi:hypothetical protein D3C86_1804740 [compost metagenome]